MQIPHPTPVVFQIWKLIALPLTSASLLIGSVGVAFCVRIDRKMNHMIARFNSLTGK